MTKPTQADLDMALELVGITEVDTEMHRKAAWLNVAQAIHDARLEGLKRAAVIAKTYNLWSDWTAEEHATVERIAEAILQEAADG